MNREPLERLLSIVPAPASPTAARGNWALVETDLGTKLPGDWKALIERYGHGQFDDFFHLLSPFFAPCTVAESARTTLDADRELAKTCPRGVPFRLFPEPGGALPWALTDNGDVAYWLTRGEPDAWPVAIWNARGGEEYDLVEGGAVKFLADWLSGERTCSIFRSDHNDLRYFDRWIERAHATLTWRETSPPPSGLEGTVYAWRLQAIFEAFETIEPRGGYGSDDEERRQIHFVASGGAWRLTYDTLYGHNVRIGAPPAELDDVKARISRAATRVGCIAV